LSPIPTVVQTQSNHPNPSAAAAAKHFHTAATGLQIVQEDANFDEAMEAMSHLGMEEHDDVYTVSSRTTAFRNPSMARRNKSNPEINLAEKIKSTPLRQSDPSTMKLPTVLVKWRTDHGKPRLSAQIHQLSGNNHWEITKHFISADGETLSFFHKMSPFMAKGELAFPTYVLDQSLMSEEDYNWHCRLLKIHPKSISHIRSIKKILGEEDLASHWFRQDIILPYPVRQQLATEADGDDYFYGLSFVHYPEDGSWHLHIEMVPVSDGYEAEEAKQCPFVQVAQAAPVPALYTAPALQARVAAPHAQYQGVQGMEIDENQHFDSAIHAGMAAAAASLPTPQANSRANQHKYVRVNDGTFSVSSSVKHKPKRTKTDRHSASSSQAAMPPPPPRVNINHTNMPPMNVQVRTPGPTPGVPLAAGLPTKNTAPAYTNSKPPPVRTNPSPFMHPIGSPFKEVVDLDAESDDSDFEDKDEDAETIYEEMSATTDSYMAQLAEQQQPPPGNMRVIHATPKKTQGAPQRFVNMGPRGPPSTRSRRSVSSRSIGSRSIGNKSSFTSNL